MKIGVVIPAHNEAEHLTDCLQSFVDQQRQPDQLLVVDDNSSDRTRNIAKDFAQKHNDNIYFMPIRTDIAAYLDGIL